MCAYRQTASASVWISARTHNDQLVRRASVRRKPTMEKEPKCSARPASCARATSGVLIALTLGAVFLLPAVCRVQLTLAQETKQRQPRAAPKARGEAELIARGKYIVEGLAACGDCHTPRNRDGG